MISNSRPVTKNIAFSSELPPFDHKVADAYSDDLMDDLFLEVDQILEGNLSSYMTVVGSQRTTPTSSARTVQLPQNFSPQSAADIYRATISATHAGSFYHNPQNHAQSQRQRQQRPIVNPPFSPPGYQAPTSQQSMTRRAPGYSGGGRPVTAARAGNFQSTVVHTSGRTAPTEKHRNTIDLHRVNTSTRPVQSVSSYLSPSNPASRLTLSNTSPRPAQTIFEPHHQPQQPVSLPFLLMGAAGISAVSTMGLWMLSQNTPSNGWLLSLSREAAAAELPNNSDEEFLVYLQQSLEIIRAQEEEANQTVAVVPVPAPALLPTTVPNTNATPQLGALPNLPGAPVTPQVIERVFVPVYQNAPTAQATTLSDNPGNLPLPNATLPPVAQRPTVPVPAPVAAAAALPPGAPITAVESVPIVPATTTQSSTTLPAPSIAISPTNAAAASTNVSPNAEHVLVGILNLGSRSAALFNLDGNAQRAYVGDRIGVSDWTLVSVNGQDVVVRRNGEVRSIYIGQRF